MVLTADVYASEDKYFDGLDAAKSDDYQKVQSIWLPLAEADHPNSQLGFGTMCQLGDG